MGGGQSVHRPELKQGQLLGTRYNVPSYSNNPRGYKQNIIKEADSGFQRGDIFTGCLYQECEYARRFWITNKQVWFQDIEAAAHLFDVKEVQDLTKKEGTLPIIQFKNGESQTPPQIGDIIVWKWTWRIFKGHVAVVLKVDEQNGYVELGEQNTNNKQWTQEKNYSRRLIIVKGQNGCWSVTNKKYMKKGTGDGKNSKLEILGWVRVERDLKYNDDNTLKN